MDEEIGFLGLGPMGEAIATRLLAAGTPLRVWNRTPERCEPLRSAGAAVAPTAREVLERCGTVFVMVADERATDAVLGRGTAAFGAVAGTLVVQLGTMSAEYSVALHDDVVAAGGRYVEAPVSGSRTPAQRGELVGMLAGDPADVEAVRPLLGAFCRETFVCGAVPAALRTKLAVNVLLITMVTGLAEAFHLAERSGVDPAVLEAVLAAGPMASTVSRLKSAALAEHDYRVQASIPDVAKNARLIADAARLAGTATPLIDVCVALYERTAELGWTDADMIAVIESIRDRDA
jgi:3-hydroxyisobutyrate dehydrogenase